MPLGGSLAVTSHSLEAKLVLKFLFLFSFSYVFHPLCFSAPLVCTMFRRRSLYFMFSCVFGCQGKRTTVERVRGSEAKSYYIRRGEFADRILVKLIELSSLESSGNCDSSEEAAIEDSIELVNMRESRKVFSSLQSRQSTIIFDAQLFTNSRQKLKFSVRVMNK